MVERYKVLKKQPMSADFERFVQDLLSVKGREFPQAFLESCVQHTKTIEDVTEIGTKGKWVSWKEATTYEDEDVLLEGLRATPPTVRSRPSKLLPYGSQIAWPRNLQIFWSHDVENDFRKRKDTETEYGACDTAASSREAFSKRFKSCPGSQSKQEPKVEPSPPPPPEPKVDPRIKELVAHLRKAHSAWDRCRRDIQITVSRSNGCENTRGSKIEADANKSLARGDELDKAIQEIERACMTNDSLNDEDMEHAAELCQDVKNLIKEAGKKLAALKAWFKA